VQRLLTREAQCYRSRPRPRLKQPTASSDRDFREMLFHPGGFHRPGKDSNSPAVRWSAWASSRQSERGSTAKLTFKARAARNEVHLESSFDPVISPLIHSLCGTSFALPRRRRRNPPASRRRKRRLGVKLLPRFATVVAPNHPPGYVPRRPPLEAINGYFLIVVANVGIARSSWSVEEVPAKMKS